MAICPSVPSSANGPYGSLNLPPPSCMVFPVSNSIDVGGEMAYGMVELEVGNALSTSLNIQIDKQAS